jgi:hypothetical protein
MNNVKKPALQVSKKLEQCLNFPTVRYDQCFVSRSSLDPHLMAAWIRIRIPQADPNTDPGGLKRGTMKEKNAVKRQIIRH